MRTVRTFVSSAVVTLLASFAFAAPAYFVQADMVRGAEGAMGEVCVPNSVFHPGEKIVFRAYVFDGETGERLDAAQIEERGLSVTVILDGESLEMAFFPHPPGAENVEFYWTHAWTVPADQPMGVYAWSVVVTDASGAEVAFEPIGQGIGLPNLMVVPAG